MARQITGTLKAPDGSVLAGATIQFTALRNELAGVPRGASAEIVTDAGGGYDLNVEVGYYQVSLTAGTRNYSLGKVLVEDAAAVDLLELLFINQAPLDTELLSAVQAEVAAAQASATDAANSATAAQASEASLQDSVANGVTPAYLHPAKWPSLVLDFARGNGKDQKPCVARYQSHAIQHQVGFDNVVTFSRASTGTYYDANGVLQTAAIDEPRFDHDPVTGEQKGLLIEEGRTNLLTYSEQFDITPWSISGTSMLTVDASSAPDGSVSAYKLVKTDQQTSVAYALQDIGARADSTVIVSSCYVKKAGWNAARITVRAKDGAYYGAVFNMDDEGWSVDPNVTNYGYEKLTNGWYRIWAAVNIGADPAQHSSRSVIYTANNYSFSAQGDGVNGIYIWGAQLEEGSSTSSYIPTVSSAVTRAKDDAYRTLSLEFNPGSFTLSVAGFEAKLESEISNRAVISIEEGDGTLARSLYLYRESAGRHVVGIRDSSGITLAASSIPAGSNLAVAWDGSLLSWAVDGVHGSAQSSGGSFEPVAPKIRIGGHSSAAIFGHVCSTKCVKLYPYAMTQAELEAITA